MIPTTHTKEFPEANEESTRLRVLHVRRPHHARFHCSTEALFSFRSAIRHERSTWRCRAVIGHFGSRAPATQLGPSCAAGPRDPKCPISVARDLRSPCPSAQVLRTGPSKDHVAVAECSAQTCYPDALRIYFDDFPCPYLLCFIDQKLAKTCRHSGKQYSMCRNPHQGHARFHCPPDESITFRTARSAETSRQAPCALPNAQSQIPLWIHDDGCMDVRMYGCMYVWMYVCMYACMYPCYPAVAELL